jgi:hypothetical protein
LEDCIDSHRGEEVGVLRHNLRAEGGDGILNELLTIVQIDRLSHAVDNFESLSQGNLETIGDSRGMNTLSQEVLASLEEGSGNNDDRGGTVTSLNVLSLRNLDEHLSGRVDYFHLLKNGGTVIGD